MEDFKRTTVIDGKIVRLGQHTRPKAMVAFCPECLTYGGTMGKHDRVCGNCGKADCHLYEEILDETQG